MLQYLLKFSISLAVLYIFYRAVLRPLTFYQWNRFYLLCYSLLSFIIPFINITPWIRQTSKPGLVNIIPSINMSAFAAGNSNEDLSLLQRLTVQNWLMIVFCIGGAVILVKVMLQYQSLRRIRQSAVLLDAKAGVQLYETDAGVSPFSFGNAIYFNRRLHTEDELKRIIQHEFVHVKQKHTIDLLLGELLCVVNWFNPFAWAIRHSIRQNLEFIADNNVVSNGFDKKEYQYLLLKVVGIPQYRIANNFNFSNLKKRIAMMNKMKSARLHLTKFLFVLPLLAVLLLAFRNSNDRNESLVPASGTVLQGAKMPAGTDPFLTNDADTLPAPAPPPAMIARPIKVNKKGYITSIADNQGECVVLVKDRSSKIIKAMTLTEWNKNKKANEEQYGEILPPPPPPAPPAMATGELMEAPAIVAEPETRELPATPEVNKLPENVMGISHTETTDKKAGTHTNTATVTLKNGAKETYDLNNAEQKAQYIKKYGELPKPVPPAAPVPRVDPPGLAPVKINVNQQAPANSPVGAVDIRPVNTVNPPLYIVNGKEMAVDYTLDKINADEVESVQVWKDEKAIDKFGGKGRNGVVEIVTIQPWYVVDGVMKPEKYDIREINPVNIESMNVLKGKMAIDKYGDKGKHGVVEITMKSNAGEYFPKDVMVIIDGKKIAAGSKINDYVKPGAIERMDVLKDKSATAIYGDEGKNGVILIKTKKVPNPQNL